MPRSEEADGIHRAVLGRCGNRAQHAVRSVYGYLRAQREHDRRFHPPRRTGEVGIIMQISFTLGGWIIPVILTIISLIAGWLELRQLGDWEPPVLTALAFVVTVTAWVVYIAVWLLGA